MKFLRHTALFLGFISLCAVAHAAVTFEIDAAIVGNSTGTGIPDGSALFLVATNNGSFALPTAGNITVGSVWGGSVNDVVVAAFAAEGNNDFGIPGAIEEQISNLNYASFPTIAAGDDVGLYWLPTVNYSSPGTVLSAGNAYGYFNTLSTGSDASGWVLPPDLTSSHTLTFSSPNAAIASDDELPAGNDIASFGTIPTISVPEPSTFALLGGVVGLAVAAFRRRKAAPAPLA